MTIPTLMNNTNKQEYVSRLKKAYSTLSQATNRIIAEQGNPRADIGGWATSGEAVFNMYKKYLSNAKVCGIDTTGCFTGRYKRMNGTSGDYDANRYTLVMADGSEIAIANSDVHTNCSSNICAAIAVDVNGAKAPNFIGYDAFLFQITENGLIPAGCNGDTCLTSNGWSCTCKVLREGAINY